MGRRGVLPLFLAACAAAASLPHVSPTSATRLETRATNRMAGSANHRSLLIGEAGNLDAIENAVVLYRGKYVSPSAPSKAELERLAANGAAAPTAEGLVAYRFRASGDWLKNLSLVVRNRTGDLIDRVWIEECFPEAQPGGETICRDVTFGPVPRNAACHEKASPLSPGAEPPLNLQPGEEKVLPLGSDPTGLAKALGESQPLSELSAIRIRVGASFHYGMQWWEGRYRWPVCGLPGQFDILPTDFFPGHMPGANGR